jgi:hypothetical protein
MNITTFEGLRRYIKNNSGFSLRTISNVITALGYPLKGSEYFKDLSADLESFANYGANVGIHGFIYYCDTVAFYRKNRTDIVSHMTNAAAELGTDIISMVQNFGTFRNSEKPSPDEIGKALWGRFQHDMEYTMLYNLFAWYALEEVAYTWYRYLEDNPEYHTELSA